MKTISGRVLVKESHAGVADLVVVAFGATQKGGSTQRAMLSNAKTRLASGFTDEDGRFQLQIDDSDANEQQTKDLALVIGVFAPDDSDDSNSKTGPQKNPLYLSSKPLMAPARSEAFIIRVTQATLSRSHIKVGTDREAKAVDAAEAVKALKQQAHLRKIAQDENKAQAQLLHKRNLRFRKYGKEMVRQLTGVPRHRQTGELHNNDLLIATRHDLAAKLKPLQDKVVTEGLKRMASPLHKRKIRLRLDANDLHDLGLTYVKGELTGSAKSWKIAGKVRMLHRGLDLIKIRGLRNPSPDALERRYLRPEIPLKLGLADKVHKKSKTNAPKRK